MTKKFVKNANTTWYVLRKKTGIRYIHLTMMRRSFFIIFWFLIPARVYSGKSIEVLQADKMNKRDACKVLYTKKNRTQFKLSENWHDLFWVGHAFIIAKENITTKYKIAIRSLIYWLYLKEVKQTDNTLYFNNFIFFKIR